MRALHDRHKQFLADLKYKHNFTKEEVGIIYNTIFQNPFLKIPDDRDFISWKQAKFLCMPHNEILFGGGAGAGKSIALLLGCLQYIPVAGHQSIIFRKTLNSAGLQNLIDETKKLLAHVKVDPNRQKPNEGEEVWAKYSESEMMWRFSNGSSLRFAYFARRNDFESYMGTNLQTIAFDELTEFEPEAYELMCTRKRKSKDHKAPIRTLATTNPIDCMMSIWMGQRFNIPDEECDFSENTITSDDGKSKASVGYIFSKMDENPFIDHESYLSSFAGVGNAYRECFLNGKGNQNPAGLFDYDLLANSVDDCLWRHDGYRDGRRDLYIGVDPGMKDNFAIVTLEKVDGIFFIRELFSEAGLSFTEMRSIIEDRICHNTTKMVIDKGAFALQMSEEFEKKYPHKVEGVHLHTQLINKMAVNLVVALQEGRLKIPNDKGLFDDLLKAKIVPKWGETKITYQRNAKGHADLFLATCLAYEAGLSAENCMPKFNPITVVKTGNINVPRPMIPKFNPFGTVKKW